MPNESRLQVLAREAAETRHRTAPTEAGHTRDFATCPHPDCVLVRQPAPPPWPAGIAHP